MKLELCEFGEECDGQTRSPNARIRSLKLSAKTPGGSPNACDVCKIISRLKPERKPKIARYAGQIAKGYGGICFPKLDLGNVDGGISATKFLPRASCGKRQYPY